MNKLISAWVVRLHQKKAMYLDNLISPFVSQGKIMDLGCGSGELTKRLIDKGHEVTPVDVVDKVKVGGLKVILYDGKKLPFADKQFDQVLLVTVLHHVSDYKGLLEEVARVCKEIIIVEDIYENAWDKLNIWFWDAVLNLEFLGHPHNNRSDAEWREIFTGLGFKIKGTKSGSIRELIYAFKQKAYWLEV